MGNDLAHKFNMKATAVLTTILSAPSLASGDAAIEYLEPNVQRIEGLLPVSICNELIAAGEKGMYVLVFIICILFALCSLLYSIVCTT